MPALLIVVIFFILSLLPTSIFGQDSNVQARTQEIVASLDKTKHKIKEKRGVRVEVFVEIKHEPALRNNPREYSGEYEMSDLGMTLKIEAAADGKVQAGGFEPKRGARGGKFTLQNARIEGALLTGTKVYESGASEKFEAVFVNRTEASGTSPTEITHRRTSFGLGVPEGYVDLSNGVMITRLFYQLKQ